jgi:hypothetical protein
MERALQNHRDPTMIEENQEKWNTENFKDRSGTGATNMTCQMYRTSQNGASSALSLRSLVLFLVLVLFCFCLHEYTPPLLSSLPPYLPTSLPPYLPTTLPLSLSAFPFFFFVFFSFHPFGTFLSIPYTSQLPFPRPFSPVLFLYFFFFFFIIIIIIIFFFFFFRSPYSGTEARAVTMQQTLVRRDVAVPQAFVDAVAPHAKDKPEGTCHARGRVRVMCDVM